MKGCPFCEKDNKDLAYTRLDRYPVSPGHSLVMPARHVDNIHDLKPEEQLALIEELKATKTRLKQEYSCDGFNIGVNLGEVAGQTVPHIHFHVIPRYEGDVPNPRGGVRWVIPEKADYVRIAMQRAFDKLKEEDRNAPPRTIPFD